MAERIEDEREYVLNANDRYPRGEAALGCRKQTGLTGRRGVDYNRFKPEQEEAKVVPQPNLQIGQQVVLQRDGVFQLLKVLRERGYRVIGPTLGRGAIVYDELNSGADLPAGWTDTQDGGTYRLKKRKDDALFGYAVGPDSWKKILHPATRRFWRAKRDEKGFGLLDEKREPAKLAFVGVRACDRQAIAVQDKVFIEGKYVDPVYKSQRTGKRHVFLRVDGHRTEGDLRV
jgi:hypothetical protein